ncbi:MAG: Two-component response regulator yesN [Ignavibacteriae bacterium]|nr:MAG: Two-component response regulator yesN [Ignavibacteriota bacterium]
MKKTLHKSDYLILLADDNESFSQTIIHFIKSRFKNSKVLYTNNGKEAVDLAFSQMPDIIILDINMPVLSGFQVVSMVKKEYPFIPIIIITNYNENEYRLEAKRVMADAFILKKNLSTELPQVMSTLLSAQIVK